MENYVATCIEKLDLPNSIRYQILSKINKEYAELWK